MILPVTEDGTTRPDDAPRGDELLVIGQEAVHALLDEDHCRALMSRAFRETSAGRTRQGLRQIIDLPGNHDECLSVMFGYMQDPARLGAKITAVYPDNHNHGLQSHMGIMTLFDAAFGKPLAVLHGGEITGRRTSAASAAATDALARPDSGTMAIIGTGEQAERHIRSLVRVRPIEEIRIWGRNHDRASRLAASLAGEIAAEFRVMPDVQDAVDGADIISTVSAAAEPILLGEWLQPGMHVNLVGSSVPQFREVDDACLKRARVFVDYMPMALHAGGEIRHALASGAISESDIIGELGEVLNGTVSGRESDADITLFKSLGMPAEDLIVADYLYRRANDSNVHAALPF